MKEYIEREAALKNQRWNGRLDEYVVFARDIETIPAADVEKERHGRWIIDKGLYKCSACSRLWSELWWAEIVPLEKMLKLMPYCPNCGARMDGGADDAVD